MAKDKHASAGVSRLRIGMGTTIAIEGDAGTPRDSLAALEAGFAAILQLETLVHPSRDGSDLPAIRQAGPGAPIAVHTWTWEVLTLSRRGARLVSRNPGGAPELG
ncbi:MAG TPA: hypothetical protein VN692_06330 [Steroidobacteraceae bacterium]|nr:hypothetical protein [Steroidobacteraceae bacterium]